MSDVDDLLSGLEGDEGGGDSAGDDILGDLLGDLGEEGGDADAAGLDALAGQADAAIADIGGDADLGDLHSAGFAEAPADAGGGAPSEKMEELLSDVPVRLRVEFGKRRMRVKDLLALGEGKVIELDRLASDPVKVYVNDQLIAEGELMVQKDDNFCVRITGISKPENGADAGE